MTGGTGSGARLSAGLRAVVFFVLLAWMAFGPFYRQVLGGKNPVFREWVMFSGIGLGVVDARYYQRLPDGTQLRLSPSEVLGYDGIRVQYSRRIESLGDAEAYAFQICQQLGAGADVRLVARVATRAGWVTERSGNQNMCAAQEGL